MNLIAFRRDPNLDVTASRAGFERIAHEVLDHLLDLGGVDRRLDRQPGNHQLELDSEAVGEGAFDLERTLHEGDDILDRRCKRRWMCEREEVVDQCRESFELVLGVLARCRQLRRRHLPANPTLENFELEPRRVERIPQLVGQPRRQRLHRSELGVTIALFAHRPLRLEGELITVQHDRELEIEELVRRADHCECCLWRVQHRQPLDVCAADDGHRRDDVVLRKAEVCMRPTALTALFEEGLAPGSAETTRHPLDQCRDPVRGGSADQHRGLSLETFVELGSDRRKVRRQAAICLAQTSLVIGAESNVRNEMLECRRHEHTAQPFPCQPSMRATTPTDSWLRLTEMARSAFWAAVAHRGGARDRDQQFSDR